MAAIPLAAAVAKSNKGSTREGLVTVETHDVRIAAEELGGYISETSRAYAVEMRKLGGKRVNNGHRGARYAFAAEKMASLIAQHQS